MNRSLPLLVAASLSILLLGADGCAVESQGCSAVGCFDGLLVTLEADSWTPGDHTVEGTIDGAPFACGFGPDFVASCEGRPDLSCAGLYADGYVSRCELAFPGLHPERVDVVVRRDGEELGRDTIRPEYTKYRPNGDCGPVCRSALPTVQLDAPPPCGVPGLACTCVLSDECACDRDVVRAAEGWSACPEGSIPRDECSPDRCGCDLEAIGKCTASCDSIGWTRQTCVGGAWGCHVPAFPIDLSTCP